MPAKKPALPDTTKLDYTTIDGVPTIQIAATITTRAQVDTLVERLGALQMVLPEARVRNRKAKSAGGGRIYRKPVDKQVETVS